MATIKLKRARNSLLNVSKLPPEVLGDIFRWNVTVGDTGQLEEGSHNFLLVCHHWFEVASCNPELWGFWGNNLRDWTERHLRYPTAPLDLVLDGRQFRGGTIGHSLVNALEHRAAQDTIRSVYLISEDSELLRSIISPLTANCEGIRSSSVESFILHKDESRTGGDTSVDLSDFFAHYSFPKLQRLVIDDCRISSWDFMTSRTSLLTTLSLDFSYPSPTPTTSQLLSILDSNPALQQVSLSGCAVPYGDNKSSRVSLHHLRELHFCGELRPVFGLLHRLDHPRNMDHLALELEDCDVTEISQVIGPYLRDYLRHRGRSQNGLGLSVFSPDSILLRINDAGGVGFPAVDPTEAGEFLLIHIEFNQRLRKDLKEEATLDLISDVPQEEIVYFSAVGDPVGKKDLSAHFPHIRALYFKRSILRIAFPVPTFDWDGIIFPSLRHVSLEEVVVRLEDWSPLIAFLERCSSSGNQLDTLAIVGPYYMRPAVEESIKGMVRKFWTNDDDRFSPL